MGAGRHDEALTARRLERLRDSPIGTPRSAGRPPEASRRQKATYLASTKNISGPSVWRATRHHELRVTIARPLHGAVDSNNMASQGTRPHTPPRFLSNSYPGNMCANSYGPTNYECPFPGLQAPRAAKTTPKRHRMPMENATKSDCPTAGNMKIQLKTNEKSNVIHVTCGQGPVGGWVIVTPAPHAAAGWIPEICMEI